MASEMLDRILEAEDEAKAKKEKAEAEAKAIVDKAALCAKEMISLAKKEALDDAKKALDECEAKAKALAKESAEKASELGEKMHSQAESKQDVCTKLIIEKLVG